MILPFLSLSPAQPLESWNFRKGFFFKFYRKTVWITRITLEPYSLYAEFGAAFLQL